MPRNLVLIIFFLFPYCLSAQINEEVSFSHEGKTVFGTLSKPDTMGKYPVIIINPGSGANDRDGTLPMLGGNVACLYPELLNETLYPYKDLAEHLVDSGYAVLRYDKLEYTYPANLGTITFDKLWLPVNSGIDYLKSRADVDTNRIILIGHSEGSSLIPHIARQRNDVYALISIAGPYTPFDSILAYQLVNIATLCNGNVPLAQSQANQILAYYEIIRSGGWNQNTPPLFGVAPEVWEDYIKVIDSTAWLYNQVALPTLFIGLGEDINVPPSELSRFKQKVTITEDFWLINGVNHYMTPMDKPQIDESLPDTIIYWLRQLNTPNSTGSLQLEKSDILVFPNPFHNEINLLFSDHYPQLTAEIFNGEGRLLGQFVSKNQAADEKWTISIPPDYPSGMYGLQIRNEQEIIHAEVLLKTP